jgi:glycerol-3-phosphate acyltransferase PlsY
MNTQTAFLVIALGYILGSFPTAYMIGKLKGINIFEIGSGNMGATNVARSLGWGWAGLVFAVDIAKGILAVWIARQLAPSEPLSTQASASLIGATAAVVGHNWSFFATLITGSLRGGKGAATAAGTWIILMPAIVVAIPIVFLALIIITTRYMSLAVMVSAAVGGVIVVGMVAANQLETVYLLWLLMPLMIIVRHHENIQRLLAGNERRLGERVQGNQ